MSHSLSFAYWSWPAGNIPLFQFAISVIPRSGNYTGMQSSDIDFIILCISQLYMNLWVICSVLLPLLCCNIIILHFRSLSSVTRNANSITILDTPGFRPNTAEPAGFDDLCYNYLSERLQLLFHEKIFTENHERYAQVSPKPCRYISL